MKGFKRRAPSQRLGPFIDTEEWVRVLSVNLFSGYIKESCILRQHLATEKFTMPEAGTWGPHAQSRSIHAFGLPFIWFRVRARGC